MILLKCATPDAVSRLAESKLQSKFDRDQVEIIRTIAVELVIFSLKGRHLPILFAIMLRPILSILNISYLP